MDRELSRLPAKCIVEMFAQPKAKKATNSFRDVALVLGRRPATTGSSGWPERKPNRGPEHSIRAKAWRARQRGDRAAKKRETTPIHPTRKLRTSNFILTSGSAFHPGLRPQGNPDKAGNEGEGLPRQVKAAAVPRALQASKAGVRHAGAEESGPVFASQRRRIGGPSARSLASQAGS
ncbi:hypothetical protein NDU88_008173 [Pleurodeles waltl]|uniref:Uncharacterized protein n=1 Tax=Pleurodeles waltl TaxID=8319 RepID=A0AAV7P476_PLEWA|nr:hypothetical protein NDU88_008173 [Pleurodeles waltl]